MGVTQRLGTIPLAIQTDSSNNVGIGGAANASYKLAVTGASLFTGAATFSSTSGIGLTIQADWNRSATNDSQLYIKGSTNGNKQLRIGYDTTGNVGYIQALTSGTSVDNLLLNPSGGNVGIGTSSPSTLLHLNATTTQLTLQNTDGGTNAERVGLFMTGGDTFKLISLNDNNTTRVDNILVANVLNGNIGIGTSSPIQKLQVDATTGDGIYLNSFSTTTGAADTGAVLAFGFNDGANNRDAIYIKGLKENGTSGNYASYLSFFTRPNGAGLTERMRITSSGRVGIGQTSPGTALSVAGQSEQWQLALTTATGTAGAVIGSPSANVLAFGDWSGTERMRITSGGNVLVGTTDNAARLVVRGISDSGSNFALWVTNSLGSLGLGVRNDTLIQAPGIFSYSYASTANVFVQSDGFLGRNTSSLKYKKNVEDYTRGLADVLKLRPVLYESKNPSEANKKFTGFIAEEIDALGLTEFVQYAEDGSPDALQYPHFVALLAAAIQELNAKVTALENK